jgi:SpoIIAA-like
MPITIQHEGDNVYRLEIRGVLRKADLDRCQEAVLSHIERIGPVKLRVVLVEFEGWEVGADWRDLNFYLKHGDRIERIAIVGDERWRSEMLMFAAADLRKAPVEFFLEDADAWAWLSAESDRVAGPGSPTPTEERRKD